MTDRWLKYEKGVIFGDKSRGGLLSQFLKDYKEHFGVNPNPSCRKCLNNYYTKYLNLFTMKKAVKCNYTLKKKYNGIQLGTNGDPIRNGEMTDKVAFKLLTEHPHGAELFEKMPEKLEKKPEAPVRKKEILKKVNKRKAKK